MVLIVVNVVALAFTAGIVIAGGGTWRASWVIVLLAFAGGLIQAEQFNSSVLHWVGLALLILAMGPVILNPVAREIRSAAWRLTISGLVSLTVIFVVWYIVHLPNFGVGYFSAFMNQCMLAGPIAGMGVVIALVRALHFRSWRWGLLAVLGLIPVLASSSRAATLATVAAACFLLVRRRPVVGFAVALLCLFAGYRFVNQADNEQAGGSTDNSLTGALSSKGTENSRTDLWQSRIDEFKSSPIFGIGIAMGTGSGSVVEEGAIRVEPGSSYLAILSMTGGVGAIAFCSALGILLFGYVTSQQQAGIDRDILNVMGVFLAVHGVAEGWILGFGSPLCFLFWLWLGKFGDAALQPARAIAKRRLPRPRFARPIGPTPTISTFKLRPDH
jgi:hypothetical protein